MASDGLEFRPASKDRKDGTQCRWLFRHDSPASCPLFDLPLLRSAEGRALPAPVAVGERLFFEPLRAFLRSLNEDYE